MNLASLNNVKVLTPDVIRGMAPAAFAEAPAGEVSDRYKFLSTMPLVERLQEMGFSPINALQTKSRSHQATAAHTLTFIASDFAAHPEFATSEVKKGDIIAPSVVLHNSHNAQSAFYMEAGFFRLVCTNGLVVGSAFERIHFIHAGSALEKLEAGLSSLQKSVLPRAREVIDQMLTKQLTDQQASMFAYTAAALRFPYSQDLDKYAQALLKVDRPEDEGNTVWAVFNRAQEKIEHGGVAHRDFAPVRDAYSNGRIQRQLWDLADYYLKAA